MNIVVLAGGLSTERDDRALFRASFIFYYS